MGRMDETKVSHASLEIDAAPATIFELIADPSRQPEWDGNDNLASAATGQRVRAVGDVFVMTLSESTPVPAKERENEVVEFEEGRLIAWKPSPVGEPQPGHLWRWELAEVGDGKTLVTHTYDWTGLSDPSRMERARSTTAERLLASLHRLKDLAES
ncbi:MAG: SRPBCC family protein [Actinomycetia bacterium]|nr:SRPBCC family protein [Actinomycetes bacterium]